ncbi:hypothetical protein L2E82_28482 [Cichorium intybus]|uniref:Uncharacterized protein n=1 Tax=Cichorium intybus TaxID=13427 RepID=A0ACB9CVX5_CICIN|nr:hypothetical protein L2E82_28482 [Cichorium intybus]
MKALTEQAKKIGIESEKVDLASVEKTATKKKVRIVKKIVKKIVIKKVPKRVSVASHRNDLEKVGSPNPNDNSSMEIQAPVPVEIEKPNFSVNDIRQVENTKEFEVSDRETNVRSVENTDCCRDKTERSDLVTASVSDDQNQIELLDREHDTKNMDVEEHAGEEVDESVKEHSEKTECDGVKLEGGSSKDMDEQVEKMEHIDQKPGDAVECQEGMKEVMNSEKTDGLNLQEDSSEKQVASRFHMKNRTKIFIHGLDQETKEEDIRKVFEEVGEVLEVKIITNYRSGKSRGCGFIKYASADIATLALKKYNNVEIHGRLCHTTAVDGSDTILLNNIDKTWNNEHVLKLLQKFGIRNITEVSVVPDPQNPKLNRGFAYLELETKRDAQIVYRKLQNKNVFGNIKVTWAESLEKEEIHNSNNNNNNYTNSVYAENIPSTWDEKEVKEHFKTFGEIESIALAKNLRSTYRSDFAFINYKTCEGAHSCIEALTYKKSKGDDGIKVSFTKSMPKVKPSMKTFSGSTVTEVKQKSYPRPHKPEIIGRHEDGRKKGESSTTDELVRLLREQASWKHGGPSLTLTQGMNSGHHHQPPFVGKQPFTQLGTRSLYQDPRAYHQTHHQIPNAPLPRPTENGVGLPSFGHSHYASGSFNVIGANPRYFQTRDQASYHGSSSVYRQMR